MRPADENGASGRVNRVLLTGDTVGGVWTFVMELAEGLTRGGVSVLLATFGPSVSETQRKQAALIPNLEWKHHFSKLEWMGEPWSDITAAGNWLSRIAADFDPDLIHLNTLCHGDVTADVPIVTTVHSCVLSWWASVKRSPLPAEWETYRDSVENSLQCATLLTAPSRWVLCQLARNYRINTADAQVIYNGRKAGLFKTSKKMPVILCVGRLWDEAKNVRALASIAGEIGWPTYLAGNASGPFHSGVSFPHCSQLGELETSALADWYGRSSIFTLPARYEPFGLSALEAALSGCALVLGDIPSLREVWGDAAVYVTPDDHFALKRALRNLIKHPEYRQTMSKRARQRAARFTQNRMVSGYLRAYSTAASLFEQFVGRHACAS